MKTLIFIIGIYANEPYSVFLDIHTLLSKVPFCLSRVPVLATYSSPDYQQQNVNLLNPNILHVTVMCA